MRLSYKVVDLGVVISPHARRLSPKSPLWRETTAIRAHIKVVVANLIAIVPQQGITETSSRTAHYKIMLAWAQRLAATVPPSSGLLLPRARPPSPPQTLMGQQTCQQTGALTAVHQGPCLLMCLLNPKNSGGRSWWG